MAYDRERYGALQAQFGNVEDPIRGVIAEYTGEPSRRIEETPSLAEAERIFTQAMREEPLEVRHYDNLACVYLHAGLPEKARSFLEAGIAIQPDNALLYFRLSVCLEMISWVNIGRQSGGTEEGYYAWFDRLTDDPVATRRTTMKHETIAAVRRAVELDPNSPRYHARLAAELCSLDEDPKGAVEHYAAAIRLRPQGDPQWDYLDGALANSRLQLERKLDLDAHLGEVDPITRERPGVKALEERRLAEAERDGSVHGGAGTQTQGCFVVTAACGSPGASEVLVLRRYRDEVLMKSRYGRNMIAAYYRTAPFIATALEHSRPLRSACRVLLIRPLSRLAARHLAARVRLRASSPVIKSKIVAMSPPGEPPSCAEAP